MRASEYHLYVGTLPPESQLNQESTPAAEGIYRFRFDAASEGLAYAGTTRGLLSPSWLAVHPGQPVIYAAERHFDATDRAQGAIAAYKINGASGELELMSRQPSMGDSPCHVSVHPSGRHAYVTHYKSGHVAAFPLGGRGEVQAADRVVLHQGSSVNPERQEGPHPHQIRPAPNARYVTVADLGLDQVLTYPVDPADGALAASPSHRLHLPPGTGPRHQARHPGGKYLFVCGELNSTLCVLSLDEAEGKTHFLSTHATLPPGFPESQNAPAEVLVHPAGRAVYVSNRGHDSIAVFSFDESTGEAGFLGTQETMGHEPRNFNVDPGGSFLIAANLISGTLVPFRVDPATLWPTPHGAAVDCPSPSCVVFWRGQF